MVQSAKIGIWCYKKKKIYGYEILILLKIGMKLEEKDVILVEKYLFAWPQGSYLRLFLEGFNEKNQKWEFCQILWSEVSMWCDVEGLVCYAFLDLQMSLEMLVLKSIFLG